jgi:enterochelin esterase-like enzyme
VGLTSGWFLVVMIAAAVGWIAATALVWPRLAWQPSWRLGRVGWARRVGTGRLAFQLAGRAGLLLGSQVLVLVAFLVWLNSYFAFYDSWSELLGTSAAAKSAAAKSAAPAKKVKQVGPGLNKLGARPPASRPARRRPESVLFYGFGLGPGPGQPGLPPHADGRGVRRLIRLPGAARYGMIARVQIKGLRSGLTASSGYVYLPPQYFQRAYAHDRFPAVLALTGYPGGARSIVDRLSLPATAARLAAAGRAPPVVYVMLNVSPVFPRDTECTNVPAGPQVASFFAIDVPLAVEQTFRVSTDRAGWGALGYSTGGYCAAKLAMMYPGTFSAAVSIAGYYVALRDWTTGNLYGGSRAYRNENDLDWRLQHLPAPPVSVLVTSSKIGENTYPGTLRFLHLIRPPMRAYAFIIPVGGHNFGVWAQELPQTLLWLTPRLGHPESASSPLSGATSRLAGAAA